MHDASFDAVVERAGSAPTMSFSRNVYQHAARTGVVASLAVSAACAAPSATDEPVDGAVDEAELARRPLPLGTYVRESSSSGRRSIGKLVLESATRFHADLVLEGPGVLFLPGPRETKRVSGTYAVSKDRPAYVDPDQRVRDAITLRYEDATYAYDHFFFEWTAPRLSLKSGSDEMALRFDAAAQEEAEPAPFEATCDADEGGAVRIRLNENRRDRGTLDIQRRRGSPLPATQSLTITRDTLTVGRDPAPYRGVRGDAEATVLVPRRALDGTLASFSSSLTWAIDGGQRSFALECRVAR